MVQKLFVGVVFRVKGADDVGLAVEDAKNVWHPVVLENNMTIVIVVGKGKESVERLPLFSLSLSLFYPKSRVCVASKRPFFQKTTPSKKEKKRQCKTLKFLEYLGFSFFLFWKERKFSFFFWF